jgi:hypothetical protein
MAATKDTRDSKGTIDLHEHLGLVTAGFSQPGFLDDHVFSRLGLGKLLVVEELALPYDHEIVGLRWRDRLETRHFPILGSRLEVSLRYRDLRGHVHRRGSGRRQ